MVHGLAKQDSNDRRSLVLMEAAEQALTSQVEKARKVEAWLAEGVWRDSEAIGQNDKSTGAAGGCGKGTVSQGVCLGLVRHHLTVLVLC